MENSSADNREFPKEIKSDNETSNPLLDIIANIQEKLDTSNQNTTNQNSNNQNIYNNVSQNFSNQNNQKRLL